MSQINNVIIAAALATLGFTAHAADSKTKKEAAKAAAPVANSAGKYSIDPAHSKVGFEVTHLVIASVEGRFDKFEGDIEIGEKFADSKVSATIDTASIDTANDDRNKHLKSPDFFDAAKYPKMTFKSKKITGTPENFKVTGDLTIKDVTKEVTLDGKFLGTVKDAYGNTRGAFNASGKINRQDYNLKWNKAVEAGPMVGDEVTINLKVEGIKAK